MKKNIKFIPVGLVSVLTPVITVSCGTPFGEKLLNSVINTNPNATTDPFQETANFNTNIFLDGSNKYVQANVVKAKIIKEADGDTVEVKLLGELNKNNLNKGSTQRIRITNIDTPEKAVGQKEATPHEQYYAKQSSAFAEKVLPIGKEVYLYTTGVDTYGRITADIFFSYTKTEGVSLADAHHSYSVEITKAGLTLPLKSGGEDTFTEFRKVGTLGYYTWYAIGLAMQNAIYNGNGFYYDYSTPEAVSKGIYLIKNNNNYQFFQDLKKEVNVFLYKDQAYKLNTPAPANSELPKENVSGPESKQDEAVNDK